MNTTIEDRLADYLADEADWVQVDDSFADIVQGVTMLRVRRQQPSRRRSPLLLGAVAASVAVLGFGLAARGGSMHGSAAQLPAEQPADQPEPPAVPMAPARVPLPNGAVLQGIVPSCTTTDSIEYDCTIESYPDRTEGFDWTGYAAAIVDETSHVSGGCRAASADALQWKCYIGQRAVDEQIVGPYYLGDWAPRAYAAG